MSENNKVKVNIENQPRPYEKLYIIPESAFADPEFPTYLEAQVWMQNFSNIPVIERYHATVIYNTPSYETEFGNIVVNPEYAWRIITDGFGGTDIVTYKTKPQTEHLSAPKYQVNFKTSGAGATYVSFGMITTIAPTSTTTVVTMDTIYSGMIGQTLIVQNLKSSGNVTITLGANTLLDSVSNVLTPGQTLHLVAMGNAVSLTDYQFAKIN